MNKAAPLLSICIPTYNRIEYLVKSIDAIVRQVTDEQSEKFELVISDNASTDGTKHIIQEYISSWSNRNIILLSGSKNVGMDANFLNCFKSAKGKFICLVSDDDFMRPGSLDKIFWILTKYNNISGIFLNSFEMKGGPKAITGISFDVNASFEQIGNRIFHLSGLVCKREIFLKNHYEELAGCFIVQAYVFLDVILDGNGIYFPERRFFEITENNSSGGYNFFVVFVTNFCDLMDRAMKLGYSAASVNRIKMRHLKYFLVPFIIDFRLNNSHTKVTKHFREGFFLIAKRYGLIPTVLLVAGPAIFLPRIFLVIVRAFVRLNRFVKQRRSKYFA